MFNKTKCIRPTDKVKIEEVAKGDGYDAKFSGARHKLSKLNAIDSPKCEGTKNEKCPL